MDGFHPIHLAVLSGNLEMIKLILSKVPETIDSVTDVSFLILSYVDFAINNDSGHTQDRQTPVMIACLKKYIDCVKLLVEEGADVTARDCVSGIHISI